MYDMQGNRSQDIFPRERNIIKNHSGSGSTTIDYDRLIQYNCIEASLPLGFAFRADRDEDGGDLTHRLTPKQTAYIPLCQVFFFASGRTVRTGLDSGNSRNVTHARLPTSTVNVSLEEVEFAITSKQKKKMNDRGIRGREGLQPSNIHTSSAIVRLGFYIFNHHVNHHVCKTNFRNHARMP